MSQQTTNQSLDELARGLASGNLSRAKALKLVGAALLGGALASIPGIAWAKPKPAGRKCNHNHQCESGQCVDGVCGGCSLGDLVTPVGGGDPFCTCNQNCQASCADCPEGFTCVTGGFCEPGGSFPVTCAQEC